jgi:GNAT superfamily N-acetyltransferase
VDAVLAQLAPPTRTKWCTDAFLLCELAVAPAHQGLGLGSALHDALIEDAPHATALLTTLDDRGTAGAHLYARRGWRRLSAPYVAPGYAHRYVVMGVRLDRCG